MKQLLYYLIFGTRGGINRARIIKNLRERPYNAHQLAKELQLAYKTINHHLKVLKKNQVITVSEGQKYGALYFLSNNMEFHYALFEEILEKVEKLLSVKQESPPSREGD